MTQRSVNVLCAHIHTHTSFLVKPELLIRQCPESLEPFLSQNTAVRAWGEELSEWNYSAVIMFETYCIRSQSGAREANMKTPGLCSSSSGCQKTSGWVIINPKSTSESTRAEGRQRYIVFEACPTPGFFTSVQWNSQPPTASCVAECLSAGILPVSCIFPLLFCCSLDNSTGPWVCGSWYPPASYNTQVLRYQLGARHGGSDSSAA